MILLQHLFDLLEFCAENNTYIQHTPSATGSQNRFSRFPVESATDQQSNLGFPRMEVVQLPFGILNDYDSAQRDDMSVRVRVIVKLSDKYDYAEQVTAMDNAKKALMEMLDYILTAQDDPTNENCLICAFDVSSAKYQFIDKLTYGGNSVGCELSIDFKQYIDWDNIVYGNLPGYPTFCERVDECLGISPSGDANKFLNEKGEWENPSESASVNIYNSNGTISGNRTVTVASALLEFTTAYGHNLIFTNNFLGLGYNFAGAYHNDAGVVYINGIIDYGGIEYSGSSVLDTLNGTVSQAFTSPTSSIIGFVPSLIAPNNINAFKSDANANEIISPDNDATKDNVKFSSANGDGTTTAVARAYRDGAMASNVGFYIGDKTTDGSFRFVKSGNDLVIQKRESGLWVTKQTII
jgi:hypothetical protein